MRNGKTLAPRRKAPPAPRAAIGVADRDGVVGALMLAPAVLYVVALVAVPFFLAMALSVSDATVGDPGIHHFVALANFIAVVRQSAFLLRYATASS